MVDSGELESAREKAFIRLSALEKPAEIMGTEKFLGDLNTRMVFSRAPMPEKVDYVVKAGDTLGELAQKYGTTKELISEINGIQNNIIRVGKSLQILTGTFSAVVDKSSNEMELRLNDRFFKRYVVGTGTDSSTPTGDYVITLRLRHPVWYRPDGEQFSYGHPDNLLGSHYLKLNTPGIGLHGTWEPESVGSQSSAGCVRFRNELIEELYKILPEGTSVKIVD
ncbi:L,D-transpeptidase family protein [Kiritimatiellaeota bacterium B1221]|nr:L,D-transpeptidase family protein [Kiritimatiellaeota bacterium B1221]